MNQAQRLKLVIRIKEECDKQCALKMMNKSAHVDDPYLGKKYEELIKNIPSKEQSMIDMQQQVLKSE